MRIVIHREIALDERQEGGDWNPGLAEGVNLGWQEWEIEEEKEQIKSTIDFGS
jgi:hypothetical protein